MALADSALATSRDVLPASRPPIERPSPWRNVALTVVGLAVVAALVGGLRAASRETASAGARPAVLADLAAIIATPTPVPPPYETDTYSIPPLSYQTVTWTNRSNAGTLEGYFLVGGTNLDIGFSVEDPAGAYLANLRVGGRYDFHYALTDPGPYIVTFDNRYSLLTSKTVSVYWRSYGPTAR